MTQKHFRPAAVTGIMGHVKDTPHVIELERKYGTVLIGMSAKWQIKNGEYRVEVVHNTSWRGVFPMTADDLEIY